MKRDGPPADLLNWTTDAANKRGLREAMLAIVEAIAVARGLRASHEWPLPWPRVSSATPVDWIGQVYETMLAVKTRRAKGVHFTPPEVAAEVVQATLAPLTGKALRIIDPAMGCGAFLLAAIRFFRARGPDESYSCELHGFDTDSLAVELARHSLWLETGEPLTQFENLRVGDALLVSHGSFDAVIGNPPFGNAIEAQTARDSAYDAQMRALYPEFAQGAFDTCLLFFGLATKLLAPHGRYGLIGPTALLSDDRPWQRFMHQHWRPRTLLLYPVNKFGAARIRTTAFIGAAGPCEQVEVHNHDAAVSATRVLWRNGSWYETVSQGPRVEMASTLGDFAEVFAGCATGAAYELSPQVGESPTGLKLITTGAIDRYACKWGQMPIRFLGRDYQQPRWPVGNAPKAVVAARDRQMRPKILLGGLTSVLEAWFDELGEAAGVVSTWVLLAKPTVPIYRLLALLNSATLSRIYMARHGAKSMSGRQTTIYKQALLGLPMPALAMLNLPKLDAAFELQNLPAGPEFDALDSRVHFMVARAFGRSDSEGREDYHWWRERTHCGKSRRGADANKA